eukprot:scaffold55802_cov80-Phaeocystis_antarctica.AAC.1
MASRRVDGSCDASKLRCRVGDGSGAVLARHADGVQQGVRLCRMRRMVTERGARHKGVAVWRRGRCMRRRPPPQQQPRAASQRAPALGPARVVVKGVSRLCLLWGRGACAATLRRSSSLAPRRSARQRLGQLE